MSEERRVTCPECGGEGKAEVEIPGGSWNHLLGGYEPDSRMETCERCDGEGEIWEEEDEDDG